MVAKAMEEDAAMRRGGGHMDPFQLQFPLQVSQFLQKCSQSCMVFWIRLIAWPPGHFSPY